MSTLRVLGALAAAYGLHVLAGRWEGTALVVDPLLVAAALGALPGRPPVALAIGLISGALQDAWNSSWYGEHSFTHLVIAYALTILAQRMDLLGLLPALIAAACATLADWGLQVGLRMLFDRPLGVVPPAFMWGIAVLANTAIALPMHRLMLAAPGERRRRR
jgi:cell shape-determining protein MreD